MNKFLILIAAFLFTFQISKAQTEKGTQNLGLDLGYNYNKVADFAINPGDNSTSTLNTKTTGFNIGPNYSYFFADNWDIGINFSYSTTTTTLIAETISTTNDGSPTKQFTDTYGGNIFIRKYVMYKNKIGFRTGAYAGYGAGDTKNTYSPSYATYDYNNKTNFYFGGLRLDMVYYPTKKLGVSANIANLEYEHYKNNSTSQGHNDGDIFNFNFINNGLSLSVFYVFGNK